MTLNGQTTITINKLNQWDLNNNQVSSRFDGNWLKEFFRPKLTYDEALKWQIRRPDSII
jgi:hypothetical protein